MARLRNTAQTTYAGALGTAQDRGQAPNSYETNTTYTDNTDYGYSGAPPGGFTEEGGITGEKLPIQPVQPKPRTYANIPGLDESKIANEAYTSDKYGDPARAFSSFVGSGGKIGRGQFDDFLGYLKSDYGMDNAMAVGDDKIDFDGPGGAPPVDIIRGDNSYWWGQEGPGGPQGQAMPRGTISAGGGPGGPGGGIPDMNGIMEILKGLFPDGGFNKDVVNRRVSNASDVLNANRKSQLANTEALLAARGQGRNDGTFGTSLGNLEDRLQTGFNSSVNDIFASESENADNRMIQALQMATGLTEEQARNAVDMARINSDSALGWGNIGLGYENAGINKMLGLGNLALGNSRSANDYNLGLGRLGLDRDVSNQNATNQNYDFIIRLMEQGLSLDQILAGGYINNG